VSIQETTNSAAGTTADPAGLSSVTGAFRRPVLRQRGPQLRKLAGLAGWAAALGVIGLVVGIRGLLVILVSKPPHWYEPTLITMGLIGIALTAEASGRGRAEGASGSGAASSGLTSASEEGRRREQRREASGRGRLSEASGRGS